MYLSLYLVRSQSSWRWFGIWGICRKVGWALLGERAVQSTSLARLKRFSRIRQSCICSSNSASSADISSCGTFAMVSLQRQNIQIMQPIAPKPPTSTSPATFFTQLPQHQSSNFRQTNKHMTNYLDKFDHKLKYAKWKQQLVLMYNYEPLSSIVKKTEDVKRQYLKKIYDENESNKKLYNTEQIAAELESFKGFSEKLEGKLAELKQKIDEWEMKKTVLAAELEDKRNTLKGILDGNYKMNSEKLKGRGIRTTTDIAMAVVTMREKAQSMKMIPKSNRSMGGIILERKPSQTSHIQALTTARKQTKDPVPLGLNRQLFEQCLDLLVRNIKSMNSSEDIQQGIYLDLVTKHKPKSSLMAPQLKQSGKGSMIYDILLKSYNERKKKEFDFDFVIEWETFKRFNWRQMLGVLLMRQGSYESFRTIAKKWD